MAFRGIRRRWERSLRSLLGWFPGRGMRCPARLPGAGQAPTAPESGQVQRTQPARTLFLQSRDSPGVAPKPADGRF